MSKSFTTAEVANHKTEKDMWLIVEDGVYDITGTIPLPTERHPPGQQTSQANSAAAFQEEHPGGAKILKRFAGKNATKAFWKYHNEHVLEKYGGKLKIGTVKEAAKL
ncbi:uncharacterized protein VDAG_00151 [Verticillium dahliae VdLs.17]|uniref:Cytochrome b5 heme-binding domain-containing protein n=2 Tax=Verticillium TaxID=1036719 RepID=G2WRG8_VERDV|nr:uncharacterized protein VDAG_00151 [Verticillium dahliae VdLs.17]EGY13469.1 hypothetical protein VDAG_00151 [Verticillium dahliae VdLs.17]KAH6709920.1 cytochrome b5-like heme/steroid binding domain-containing protein [Verticillium dahliae]